MGSVDRFFAAGVVLPTMPKASRWLLANFEDRRVDLRAIVELAERDASLCAKILKLANSGHYRLAGNVTDLRQAAALLGLETLRNLLLAATVQAAFARATGFDRVRFWRHCVASAGYSRWLGRALGFNSTRAYQAGFLLRSGQLLMATEIPHMVAATEAECLRPGLRMSVERQKIGCSHPQVTGELARHWGLPHPMIEAFQHAPDPLQALPFSTLAAVLNLAATAADAGDLGLPRATALSEADPKLVSHLRLAPDWLQANTPSYESLTYSADALCSPD